MDATASDADTSKSETAPLVECRSAWHEPPTERFIRKSLDTELLHRYTPDEFARNPYVPGGRVVKSSHDDPDVAVVVDRNGDDTVDVVYSGQLGDEEVSPDELASYCDEQGIKRYSYGCSDLAPAD